MFFNCPFRVQVRMFDHRTVKKGGKVKSPMTNLIHLLFEARMLKEIPRSGYSFLGVGKESVSEHSYLTAFIVLLMTRLEPEVDALRMITMALIHDLAESRIGDLNYVQRGYVTARETDALKHSLGNLPFAEEFIEIVNEFNREQTLESQLVRDADQIALLLELKSLQDAGYVSPQKWISAVRKRVQTETGKRLTNTLLETDSDEWWLKNYVDRKVVKE
jgi:putative hydrolase of HD superfamily